MRPARNYDACVSPDERLRQPGGDELSVEALLLGNDARRLLLYFARRR
jgi:hypothetical protein